VVPNFHPFVGGIERIVQDLTKFQKNSGIVPSVIFPDRLGKFPNTYFVEGVAVIPFHFPKVVLPWFMVGMPNNGKFSTSAITRIFSECRKLLQSEKPDIVHLHGASEISIPLFNIARSLSIPTIFHVHQEYIDKISKPVEKKLLKEATHLITVSRAVQRSIADITTKNSRIGIVLNGIESSHNNLEQIRGKNRIIMAGRFSKEKGFDLGLMAFAKLLESKNDCELVLLGNGPEGPRLIALARELGINGHVFFKGVLPKESLLEECRNASCALIPTPISEAFSIFAIEAMSVGTPVVATNVGGLPEVITNGVNGVLVEPKIEAIASAVLKVLENEEWALELGRNAFNSARNDFGIDRLVSQIADEYTFALKGL
jgi:glycosyltransferase involved in cell wall biosynthesis